MIEQIITPVTHDLGAFKVRRALPARERTMVGPFIFVDQFGPARLTPGEGMDVRPHPHINLATVTYLFDGAIQHGTSIGSRQRIEAGAINLMTAGRRASSIPSARPPTRAAEGPSFYGMQTWLALARRQGGDRPGVRACAPDGTAAGRRRRRFGAGADGDACGARPPAPPAIRRPSMPTSCSTPAPAIPIDAEADERAIMVTEGEASLDGQPLEPFALYVLAPGHRAALERDRGRRGRCCWAAAPSPRGATSSGTSSAPRATGSNRPRRTGSSGASR